jgi:hypothetical protein
MDQISQATTRLSRPYHGPVSSEDFNELISQVVLDFANLINNYNQYLQPLIDSLPGGSRQITEDDRSSGVDPIANGMDGSQLYTDLTSPIDNPLSYNDIEGRPATILESLVYLRDQFLDQITLIQQMLIPATGLSLSYLSTDVTLADNSDAKLPTQRAVKTYADTQLATKLDIDGDGSQLTGLSWEQIGATGGYITMYSPDGSAFTVEVNDAGVLVVNPVV